MCFCIPIRFIDSTFDFAYDFRYWPIIDNALRTAAIERKIHVRLLISMWKHTSKSEIFFLKSLAELTDSYAGVKIEVVSL